MFDLVADVESYPEFVPHLTAIRVVRRDTHEIEVDMLFALGVLRRRIRSIGTLRRPGRIDIASRDAPFRFFGFHWTFEAIGKQRTRVGFEAEFAFRNRIWQRLFAAYISQGLREMVDAFLRRADQVHGDRPGQLIPVSHSA
jgi:coenzyme Q-binding protein COQ10